MTAIQARVAKLEKQVAELKAVASAPLPVSLPSTESLQRAAQAWCKPETQGIEMDTRLALAFARILDAEKQ